MFALFVILTTLSLGAVSATGDHRVMQCRGKCYEFEQLQSECEEAMDCYRDGFNDFTVPCLEQCWHIAAPCRMACIRNYDTIAETCAARCDDRAGIDNCFEECFQMEFDVVKSLLPETKK